MRAGTAIEAFGLHFVTARAAARGTRDSRKAKRGASSGTEEALHPPSPPGGTKGQFESVPPHFNNQRFHLAATVHATQTLFSLK